MKMHFGYDSITVNQRGAHDMAAVARPRITRDKLQCGDLIFFGPKGPGSSVNSIYHAALYLGRGWFIHSTGSSDGVTLASLNTSVLERQLRLGSSSAQAGRAGPAVPSPSPSPSSSPSPSAAPSPWRPWRRRLTPPHAVSPAAVATPASASPAPAQP